MVKHYVLWKRFRNQQINCLQCVRIEVLVQVSERGSCTDCVAVSTQTSSCQLASPSHSSLRLSFLNPRLIYSLATGQLTSFARFMLLILWMMLGDEFMGGNMIFRWAPFLSSVFDFLGRRRGLLRSSFPLSGSTGCKSPFVPHRKARWWQDIYVCRHISSMAWSIWAWNVLPFVILMAPTANLPELAALGMTSATRGNPLDPRRKVSDWMREREIFLKQGNCVNCRCVCVG